MFGMLVVECGAADRRLGARYAVR